ncbi:striatin-interacting protein 1 homolog [Macrobrachium rosenbergii]|uniref:striatin-interacting protein 1 homolog n=1 Tax=Macrobrachium rosenbergii TaxID=79674 RepID=UPI0034D6C578
MSGNVSPGGNGSPSGGCKRREHESNQWCVLLEKYVFLRNLQEYSISYANGNILSIMMLVVFKSAPILKRTLKVKHAMMQLYVLAVEDANKIFRRQWRKTNMKTMSAIYQKVRHRLNDDWAYGNDPDARPVGFQTEECALRACVDRFKTHTDIANTIDSDFEPLDNCVTSVLGRPVELTEFKRHYEVWLQQEVFQLR